MTMNQYWFKPKRYGYGATPVTWEGWALTFGACATILLVTLMVSVPAQVGPAMWTIWLATTITIVAGLWVISRRRTEGVWRWRWGHEQD
jgi:O-antigen/teichoic acid export membrane protein